MPKFYNTRFNPTPTGDLHLGHVYLCLVNLYEARANHAQFHVRFDDTQLQWAYVESDQATLQYYARRNLEDLDWLGITVDKVWYQSDFQEEVHNKMWSIFGVQSEPERLGYSQLPTVVGLDCVPYPYASPLVPEKVWFDFMIPCDYLIRGIDLITEFSLYCYWVDRFRMNAVKHVYLPRLALQGGDDPSYMGTVSKTHGTLTVRSFREAGVSPGKVSAALRLACLKEPTGPWMIDNVKRNPTFPIGYMP